MQQRDRRRISHRQADLFEAPSDRPSWQDLPEDTRRTVTELLARMLRQQRRRAASALPEVEHE
jgi:hypothetical protein